MEFKENEEGTIVVTIYEISCEWDMGMNLRHLTEESAEIELEETDWEVLIGMSLEEAKKDGMVSIGKEKLYLCNFKRDKK